MWELIRAQKQSNSMQYTAHCNAAPHNKESNVRWQLTQNNSMQYNTKHFKV